MPELPEVETIARSLRPALEGITLTAARVLWPRTIAEPSAGDFEALIPGQRVEQVTRRAKYLWLRLSGGKHLFVHLRMSGDLLLQDANYTPAKHDRLIFALSDGRWLVFTDTRKFGRVWLVSDLQRVIGKLGPEPLSPSFTAEKLYVNLSAARRQLKPLLLDQAFVAGLGNIYTDEALHRAGLHPLRSAATVSTDEARRLHQAIQSVLASGIEQNGASIDWVYRGGNFQNHFSVYGRKGQPCPVCGAIIQKIVVGQRGTHFCPRCQKAG